MILFDFWRVDSVGGLVASMVACFALGVVYEGIKLARDVINTAELEKRIGATGEGAERQKGQRGEKGV